MKKRFDSPSAMTLYLLDLKYLPRWGVLLLDLTLSFVAIILSFALGSSIFKYGYSELSLPIWSQVLIVLALQTICFAIFRTYSGIIRYSTFTDVINILKAVVTTVMVTIGVNLIFRFVDTPKPFLTTVLIIYFFVASVLLFCYRVGIKTIYDSLMQSIGTHKRVFIYGTQAAGLAIAKMLNSAGAESQYIPIGFIADKNDKEAYRLQGLTVYPLNDRLISLMKEKDVHDVIVSPTKMKQIHPATDLAIFLKNDIHILTTPSFTEWEKTSEDELPPIGNIESIHVEDLLERPTIQISTDNVASILRDHIVMVTGAAGSIGQEIVRQVLSFHPRAVVLVEQAESPLHDFRLELRNQYPDEAIIPIIGDVRNHGQMEHVFAEYKPEIVFHAAAYKHVPLMEEFPNEAVRTNVLGTKIMADLSLQYDIKRFVMISTDKAVNPTNVMGASKRIAEMYVQSLFKKLQSEGGDHPKFITTRFGNVLGSNGSVIPYFKKQIALGGPVTVTHPDIIRYFMTIPEACTLVLEAATLGQGGEIFVFDMGLPVKILDLAKNMIRLAGYRPGVDIMITFTGLRPGEKLYEEVLNARETVLPTSNNKIMIAQVREENYAVVSKMVDELITISNKDRSMATVAQMKKIVPDYKSKNSIYEQLD